LNFIDDSLSCWRKEMTCWHAATSATAAASLFFFFFLHFLVWARLDCWLVSIRTPPLYNVSMPSTVQLLPVAQVLRRHVIDIGRSKRNLHAPFCGGLFRNARRVGRLVDLSKSCWTSGSLIEYTKILFRPVKVSRDGNNNGDTHNSQKDNIHSVCQFIM
jgi:hypothetical protein